MKRTNIEIDERKIEEGMRITGIRTRKELVDFTLAELLRKERLKQLLNLKGKIEFWPDYDAVAE